MSEETNLTNPEQEAPKPKAPEQKSPEQASTKAKSAPKADSPKPKAPPASTPKMLGKVLVGKNELMLVGKGKKVFKGRKVDFSQAEWKALPQYYKDLFTDYVARTED